MPTPSLSPARSRAGATIPVSSKRTDKISGIDPAVFDRFRQENARRLKGFEAPEACIQAVKAAVEPALRRRPEEGKRELFSKLVTGTQSAALRHNFFAERAGGQDRRHRAADIQLIPIKKVGILGAGTMGGGIGMNFLSAGIEVVMVEREQAPLDRGVGVIRKNYENTAKRGRLTGDQVEAAMGKLKPTLSYDEPRRLRPGDRGRVREHGREEGGVRAGSTPSSNPARSWRPTPAT